MGRGRFRSACSVAVTLHRYLKGRTCPACASCAHLVCVCVSVCVRACMPVCGSVLPWSTCFFPRPPELQPCTRRGAATVRSPRILASFIHSAALSTRLVPGPSLSVRRRLGGRRLGSHTRARWPSLHLGLLSRESHTAGALHTRLFRLANNNQRRSVFLCW